VGDQVGVAVSGALSYVPYREFERVRSLPIGQVERTDLFAAMCRINTLYMIARAGSGHIGSSFSSLDIMSWLMLNEMRSSDSPELPSAHDIFFSSKGHDAPGLYNVWIGLGALDFELIHQLRRIGGLPGHPDVNTPNVIANTGSLGMGVSKAKGMIFANRLKGKVGNVFVLTGDGELQEGQVWESLISAANHQLHELTVIVDHNKLQSDTKVSKVSDLGDLEAKFSAFGWHVSRCNGNDLDELSATLAASKRIREQPKVIIADTIKGKGVSFMEHTSIDSDVEFYKFHSGAPSDESYARAARELIDAANAKLAALRLDTLQLETIIRPALMALEHPQRLIQAYAEALRHQARQHSHLVALDADLILDTGLIPFQQEFPERFIECGIAEQDMVSQAGGMALQGLLPVVHSFACFLSARPNEQIYNNATEGTKIIYVGSLAGLLPGGPGHSHQAVRDISALAAIPGLTLMEPSCESEVRLLLDWAVNTHAESSYLRLVSIPWVVPFTMPEGYRPKRGKGVVLRQGEDIAIIGYGPITLSAAVQAATDLNDRHGISVTVINLPWLNVVDGDWLSTTVGTAKHLFAVDNHYAIGGQADAIARALVGTPMATVPMRRIAVDRIPASGTNAEVLHAHSLTADAMIQMILSTIRG
jgi:transketolase